MACLSLSTFFAILFCVQAQFVHDPNHDHRCAVLKSAFLDPIEDFIANNFEVFEVIGTCIYRHASLNSIAKEIALPECLMDRDDVEFASGSFATIDETKIAVFSQGKQGFDSSCAFWPRPVIGKWKQINDETTTIGDQHKIALEREDRENEADNRNHDQNFAAYKGTLNVIRTEEAILLYDNEEKLQLLFNTTNPQCGSGNTAKQEKVETTAQAMLKEAFFRNKKSYTQPGRALADVARSKVAIHMFQRFAYIYRTRNFVKSMDVEFYYDGLCSPVVYTFPRSIFLVEKINTEDALSGRYRDNIRFYEHEENQEINSAGIQDREVQTSKEEVDDGRQFEDTMVGRTLIGSAIVVGVSLCYGFAAYAGFYVARRGRA